MINPTRKTLKIALMLVAGVIVLVSFSAFHAYKVSDGYIRDGVPPPFYGITFVLHPNRYIDGASELGFKPGWVVTYAPHSKNYGTAFFVSLFGSMLASGTPAIVANQNQQWQKDIKKFQRAFAQVDAAIQVGMTLSNVVANLKIQPVILTNVDGTVDAFYHFTPRALEHIKVDWLTNSFRLEISNGVVIKKFYGFTSSH